MQSKGKRLVGAVNEIRQVSAAPGSFVSGRKRLWLPEKSQRRGVAAVVVARWGKKDSSCGFQKTDSGPAAHVWKLLVFWCPYMNYKTKISL